MFHSTLIVITLVAAALPAQSPTRPQSPTESSADGSSNHQETLRHFQALLKFDTSDPPGHERPAVDYLKQVLEAEGIAVEVVALEPNRPSLIARLKGSGAKRPILLMGHTDVVNVDPKKWTHPPFGAVRDGG